MAFSTSSSTRAPIGLRAGVGAVGAVFASPAIYLLWRNFTSDADPLGLLVSDRTLGPLYRTVQLAVSVTLSATILGTALAWLTTRADLPGGRLLRVLLPLPLVYPTFVGAAAFIRTVSSGGLASDLVSPLGIDLNIELRGLFGAWLALTLFTYPYVYLPVAARLRTLPQSLEAGAGLLGDSGWMTFRRVVLPQTKTAISAGSLLVFLYSISDFGAVQLMGYDTLTRAIWTTRLNDQPVSFALSAILLGLAAVVVGSERLIGKRNAPPGRARGGIPRQYALGRGKLVISAMAWAFLFLALFAPAAALFDWALDGIREDRQGGRGLFIDLSDVVGPALNTTLVGLATAALAVIAVLPVAFLAGRYRSRIGGIANTTVISTFALPGLLVALAVFFFTLRNPWANEYLRGTLLLLVIAYVLRFGAQALGAAHVSVASVPPSIREASKLLGATPLRHLATVELPLMAPGLLAGAGLVLLSTMKELPITLLVAPFDFPTLTTKIFLNFEDAFIAEAGILAVVLVLLSAVLTWALVIRRADHLD